MFLVFFKFSFFKTFKIDCAFFSSIIFIDLLEAGIPLYELISASFLFQIGLNITLSLFNIHTLPKPFKP